MKLDIRCEDARRELSARLDGEADPGLESALGSHLADCSPCRAHEADLLRVRAALRVQEAEQVPDLAAEIMAQVSERGHRSRRSDEWRMRARVAGIAAVIAALLLASVTTPWLPEPSSVAVASEIVDEVRRSARALQTFRATYEITEHGWHAAVPTRTFKARVFFDAPERFRLQLRDLTAYPDPSEWPANDVDVVAGPRKWWIKEPRSCPRRALPGCSEPSSIQRSTIRREPFDGTSNLPTDIVVPLETLASSESFEAARRTRFAGRDAYRIELSYRDAVPLVTALQTGGSWRELYPLDEVDLWIDRETRVPLRFVVRAERSKARALWAAARFLNDRPGSVLLAVEATTFAAHPTLARSLFDVPRASVPTDGGFRATSFKRVSAEGPSYVAGLPRYRAGRSHGRAMLAYADGMTWLKVSIDDKASRHSLAAIADPAGSEQVSLGGGGFGYYRPAGESFRRQVDVYARGMHAHLESNLPRTDLLEVAASMPVTGRRLPVAGSGASGLKVIRLRTVAELDTHPIVKLPRYLPQGYLPARPSAALLYRSRRAEPTIVVYYRQLEAEYDGFGIRVRQSPARYLPPSSEQFVPVRVGGEWARYFAERNELEWINHGVYRSVAAPSFDLATVVAIARSLR